MTDFQLAVAALAAVVLFLHGLHGLSRELQRVGGEPLRLWLARTTRSRLAGFALGAGATAVLQSSSAVSAIVVTLVEGGTLAFRGALPVLLGSNVGTTATAWLVTLQLTQIGPVAIVAGTLIGMLPWRIRVIGRMVFYFGFVMFALDLLSASLEPLHGDPRALALLAQADIPWRGVLGGALFTAAVQSSSVSTGLAILLVQQGLLTTPGAIAIVVGANIGTTTTALLAAAGAGPVARRTAMANLGFNVGGALLVLPVLGVATTLVLRVAGPGGATVATAHLLFNLFVGFTFLALLALRDRLRPSVAAHE